MANETVGFTITPSGASFMLTLVGLLAVLWQGVSYVKAQEQFDVVQDLKIERVEIGLTTLRDDLKGLTAAISELRTGVVGLTTVIEERSNKRNLLTTPNELVR